MSEDKLFDDIVAAVRRFERSERELSSRIRAEIDSRARAIVREEMAKQPDPWAKHGPSPSLSDEQVSKLKADFERATEGMLRGAGMTSEPKSVPRGHCGRCVVCGGWLSVEGAVSHQICDIRFTRKACAGCGAPYETSGDAPQGVADPQPAVGPEAAGKPAVAGASIEPWSEDDLTVSGLAVIFRWDGPEMRAVRALVTREVARAREECAKLLDAFAAEADGVANAHAAVWAEECARRIRALAEKEPKP